MSAALTYEQRRAELIAQNNERLAQLFNGYMNSPSRCIRCGNGNVRLEGGGSRGYYRYLCINGCQANYQLSRAEPHVSLPCWVMKERIEANDKCFDQSYPEILKDLSTGKATGKFVTWNPQNHAVYFKDWTKILTTIMLCRNKSPKTLGGIFPELMHLIFQFLIPPQLVNLKYKCFRCDAYNTNYVGKDKLFPKNGWWQCEDCMCYCHGRNFRESSQRQV